MIGDKIIKIMSEIKPIEKTGVDEEKKYKFAKSEDIIAMVNPLLVKYKVIIVPVKVVNFSAQGHKVFITMKYQFIDVETPEKETIEVEIPGSGFDEKGRAVYAALTGAYRYAMQEVFAIPIVDEIRNDNSNNGETEEQETDVDDVNNIQEDGFIDFDNTRDSNNVQEMNPVVFDNVQDMSPEEIERLFTTQKVT